MMLLILLSVLGLVWILTTWALRRIFEEADRMIVLDDLGEYSTVFERGGHEAIHALFSAGTHTNLQWIRVTTPDGKVLIEEPPDHLNWPALELPGTESIGHPTWQRMRQADGSELTIGHVILSDGSRLAFGRTNRDDLHSLNHVQSLLGYAMLAAALLCFIPSIWFADRVLRPLRHLIAGAQTLVRDDAAIQRLSSSPAIPELHEFAEAFNQGLSRIQSLTEELEAANDQLAHELRTPLARIRGNIERLLSQPDPAATRDIAVHALSEIDRATHLIQTILTVRAGESRTIRLQREPIHLRDLLAETCDLYAPAAEAKGLVLASRLPETDVEVQVDRQRLQQALCNLLDNAIAYTRGDPGQVSVHLDLAPTDAFIRVRDTGPGLTELDHSRIWRRFMRGSAASAASPGIGLGLSLVRSIATAHGGDCGAQNRTDRSGGAEFWIRLPLRVD